MNRDKELMQLFEQYNSFDKTAENFKNNGISAEEVEYLISELLYESNLDDNDWIATMDAFERYYPSIKVRQHLTDDECDKLIDSLITLKWLVCYKGDVIDDIINEVYEVKRKNGKR